MKRKTIYMIMSLKKTERELKLKCMELEKREKQIQIWESQLKGQIQDLAQAADTDAKADSVHNEQDNVVIERKNVNEKEEKHETTNISRPTFIAPGACLGSLNNMLKNKFWGCLRSDRLKNATRIHYETLTSFEGLRRKVRAEEYEMKIASGVNISRWKQKRKEIEKLELLKMNLY